MNKYLLLLVFVCGLAAGVGCSGGKAPGHGQGNGNGGGAGTNGNGTGGVGNFGNGDGGVVMPTLPTLPDGGALPSDPTMKMFVADDTTMSGLDQGTVDELKKGGTACTAAPIYPYAGTVFPRGLPAPTVMWTGAADAAYVHMRYANKTIVDYQFAVKGTDSLQVPRSAWDKIVARSADSGLLVTLTVKTGGTISTCETNWTIAGGTMSGALYYNTYNAPGAMFPNQGAVMRLKLGEEMSEIYLQDPSPKNGIKGTGPCISCHSVSFDGSMLVASRHDYGGNALAKVFSFQVSSYPVTSMAQPTALAPIPRANFGGLYPDGKRMLIMGNPQCTNGAETFPRAPNNFIMVEGPTVAKTVDTKTGMDVAATGLNKDWYMWMPQFSPDGKKVVFNHAKPGAGGTDRRELAVMDYDYATNTFSNLKVIATNLGPAPSQAYSPAPTLAGTLSDNSCQPAAGQSTVGALPTGTCTGPCYPGWPFFTPDGRGVVFLLTNEPDFASAFPGRTTVTQAELWYADLASGKTVRLDNANAMMTDNFYPTVMPVALGGYYWVFFTSKRTYGNKTYPELMHSDTYALSTKFAEDDAKTKRIWVSALRPVPMSGELTNGLQDISSPAFFLDGQSESGNVRAFTTLNPCAKKGDSCASGLDCCGGYCNIPPTSNEFDIKPMGTCTDEPPSCSKTNERCTNDSNCCPPTHGEPQNTCIGGYCAYVVVPQ
jgi:hypothetical protein